MRKQTNAPSGWPTGHWPKACWLELFRFLAGKKPGDFCAMAWVVDLLGAGCDAVTAEVLPLQAMGQEDPDKGAACATHRDRLLVLGRRGICGGLARAVRPR